MSTAKRRINSTGRKRIMRDRIDIRMLSTQPGEPLKATASLRLDGLGFPGSAGVAIEAYHRSSGMRFDCGNVENLTIPSVLQLEDVDRSGAVLFRVKVIDNDDVRGKLLGSAERIHGKSDDDADGRRSIFPIIQRDLGELVWTVEVDQDVPPALILNYRIPSFTHRVLDNPLVQGVLLPAALRIVLQNLAGDSAADEEDDSDWHTEWLRYCQDELGIPDDPSDMVHEQKKDWIEEVIQRFCEKAEFVSKINTANEGTY